MPAETAPVQYVFLDVENFTVDRTVEAQADIIDALNQIVRAALAAEVGGDSDSILLPTGDGLCIALLGRLGDLDLHLRLALKILSRLHDYNTTQTSMTRRFELRVGVNQNIDNIVLDINGRRNVAGAGVNTAQRVMSVADGGQILLSSAVHEILRYREQYHGAFREHHVTVKHDVQLAIHQYTRPTPGVNIEVPTQIALQNWQSTYDRFEFFFNLLPLPLRMLGAEQLRKAWREAMERSKPRPRSGPT